MTAPHGDLARRVAILADALAAIEREPDEPTADQRHRPATVEELRRVADEVTIPAAVAALETNRRVLERLEERSGETHDESDRLADPVAERSDDDESDDDESANDEHDDEVAQIVARAAGLQADVEAYLEVARRATRVDGSQAGREPVPVDVEAEIKTIRREIDGRGDDGDDD